MYLNNLNPIDVNNTLNQLNTLIIGGEAGELSPEYIERLIFNMANSGVIKIVGKGTNRIAVEINGSIAHLLDNPTQASVIIKIPYTPTKGLNDNFREYLLYKNLIDRYNKTRDARLKYLLDTLPYVSAIKGFPCLIAQERVTPIQEFVPKGTPSNNISAVCTELILTTYKAAYMQLMNELDNHCIFADLNPLITPFQFGVKANGTFTILDTGYTIPKFMQLEALYNGNVLERRNYLIVGKDIILDAVNDPSNPSIKTYRLVSNNSKISKEALSVASSVLTGKMGLYILTNGTANTPIAQLLLPDMQYFFNVYNILRDYARQDPFSEIGRYFAMVSNIKSQISLQS